LEKITTIRKKFNYRLKSVPKVPGVYIFKDINNHVIYVGKAIDLQKRVSSYFGKKSYDSRISHLKKNIHDFEINISQNQNDALVLESSLIKKFQPKYNIRLKDDKSYPYILINLNEDFPKIQYTRNITYKNQNKLKIFGPFSKAKDVRKTIDVLNKLLPYCTTHVKRCVTDCENAISKDQYRDVISQVIKFLDGDQKYVLKQLNEEMNKASSNKMYERAGRLRDQIDSINEFYKLSKSKFNDSSKIDYIGFTKSDNKASFQLFESRYSNINNSFKFIMEGTESHNDTEILTAFINQYYLQKHDKPEIIIVPTLPNLHNLNLDVLKSQNKRIKFKIPRIGEKRRILNLAINNSKYNIDHEILTLSDTNKTLENLKEKLNLNKIPKRIECYDISNIQGTDAVGSMVVFTNGIPSKSEYRRYKIKTVKQVDDYSMMSEMLTRRLNKLDINNSVSKPDLILIDGGIGHLSATHKVVLESQFPKIPIASIAKKHEYIYTPNSNKPLNIDKLSNEGILLQQLRDEAHRFAIDYHRKLRSKRSLDHPLQKISGIGPVILNRLLVKYKSIEKVKNTHYQELLKIDGINSSLAKKILTELKK